MKVRWTENSIRVRITPSELEAVEEGDSKSICSSLYVRGIPFWTVIVLSHDGLTTLDFDGETSTVTISLGPDDTKDLCIPDAEGIYLEDAATNIRYYIEKDFPCAHPRAVEVLEPKTETFDPPAGFMERKMG
jgi:hypothetical protein